ncbi:hypothetical protein GMORB2_7685 [Geosmithia morbida]|uniref:Alpha/beta hydrolase fold-3 domain-containing protein n=1 Tax=Geosmithia morbida TaxID=1094350 RepID=A0A9P4YUK3_9HYPO|nr:uncharacterized protein GMORB2_7685 [Geosmithia morbida]KAF4122092.1 hypothetical protein GMORB2_7685 [Geosmithia morbida]
MPTWPRTLRRHVPRSGHSSRQSLTTRSAGHERVDVPCGSSGDVTIDLFNLDNHGPNAAVVIYLPPFPWHSSDSTTPTFLPEPLRHLPVACINYRWERVRHGLAPIDGTPLPAQWPAPVHDTAFAYAWLKERLAPPGVGRRNAYVCGSFLGASLAASLALTECHAHARFGIRGLVAHNGVYNWTAFLPGHPLHRRKATANPLLAPPPPPLAEGLRLRELRQLMGGLFPGPECLFDPFASPSLFFHSPGLHVPRDFDDDPSSVSSPLADMVSRMTGRGVNDDGENRAAEALKPPRKSHLIFPPRTSTLKIPETLLLHDRHVVAAVTAAAKKGGRKRTPASAKRRGNTFATQADELAGFMRRSVEKVEIKERKKWDCDMDGGWDAEPERRVRVVELDEADGLEMGAEGQETALNWLEDRLRR